MLIRVRSNVGVWRIDGLSDDTATVEDILTGIAQSRPDVVYECPLSRDPACQEPLDSGSGGGSGSGSGSGTATLASLGLRHGSMVHCRVDASTCVDVTMAGTTTNTGAGADSNTDMTDGTASTSNMKRIIDKDGSIKLVPSTEIRQDRDDKGFRKGMMPLRDIKMAWTLNEFVAMDAQFVFKVQRQQEAICKQASLESPSVHDFQSYLQRFQFQRKRYGLLYGSFVEDPDDATIKKVKVEAIYEPPQQPNPDAAEGFEILEDPLEETVDQIATLCGLTRVGWIFGHAPRAKDLVLTSAELIMAAEFQLEAAGGVEETPFVTVKVTQQQQQEGGDGGGGNVAVEAFQVSQQCMAMVAEEALEIDPTNPGVCQINKTFTAIQEGKDSKTVENNFFITVVPIAQHTSEVFVNQFPKVNRDLDDRTPSKDELKRQLAKSGSQGWTFMDLLADFNLLIFLSKSLDVNADFPNICQSVVDRKVPLDDGYKIIIASLAGLDGSY